MLDSERATSSLLTIGTFSKHGKATEAEPRESPSARNHISPYVRLCVKVRLCIYSSFERSPIQRKVRHGRESFQTIGKVAFPSTPSLAAVYILHHGSLNHNRNMGAYADTGLTLSKTLSPCAIMKEKQRVY